MQEALDRLKEKFPNLKTHLYSIRNDFFGERITVAGLITGQDLIGQLKGNKLGTKLLLPCNMFRDGEDVFLDDVTVNDIEKELNVKVRITGSNEYDLIGEIYHEFTE